MKQYCVRLTQKQIEDIIYILQDHQGTYPNELLDIFEHEYKESFILEPKE